MNLENMDVENGSDVAGSVDALELDKYLEETTYLDYNNPVVSDVAHKLTDHLTSERDKACALFGYVRDSIKFGWTYQFSAMKASDVMLSGYGYSITKATLFIALLRCVNIPSRQVFVDISAEILRGFEFPSGLYLDHCYVEVYINRVWVKTDAYILDSELFDHAKERLLSENHKIGFGVHAHGSKEWDGACDSFCQFVNDGYFTDFSLTQFGVMKDANEFYGKTANSHNNFDIFFPLTAIFYASFYIPNNRVGQLREDKLTQFYLIDWK